MQSIPQPSGADQMGLMALLAFLAITCPIYKGSPSEYKPLRSHKYSKGIRILIEQILISQCSYHRTRIMARFVSCGGE